MSRAISPRCHRRSSSLELLGEHWGSALRAIAAYGLDALAAHSVVSNARRYTDAESGLQYLRARYYEPATGQLLTRDPASAATRDSYGYSTRTPLNASDPTGLYSADSAEHYAGYSFHAAHNGSFDFAGGNCYIPGHIKDYMTGALPPPKGFEEFAGYTPVRRDSKAGRGIMEDPGGSCSGGWLLADDARNAFDDACKSHDYAYDLLRYADSIGSFSISDRYDADSELGTLMDNVCGETGFFGWWSKERCYVNASYVEQFLKMWTTVEGPP